MYRKTSNQDGLAGPLNIPVQIQTCASSGSCSSSGDTWAPVLTTMAGKVAFKQAQTYVSGGGFADTSTDVFEIRWTAVSIAPGMRLLLPLSGKTFNIQHVENVDERNRILHIYCSQ